VNLLEVTKIAVARVRGGEKRNLAAIAEIEHVGAKNGGIDAQEPRY
jgi:hypothetical protein